ncbi:phytoene desaturase family protein [Citricoccus sp. NR2]|uniref:phytoene desaturase family protein n=1 Tax=Citricoccus sp. NR2 TaxID=3004095 RepID=UPI0022DD9278|nr:NAD(P)/FAD-dependent oxidoreductase [Citricoccus sp. NR2]WBL19472.1 NAD(P)/FAD-dependent oxidoreductase [Citricoccus sp. NR2]
MNTSSHPPGRVNVVGSGPNGLTAGALLARAGWDVQIFERAPHPGGAAASTTSIFGDGVVVDQGAAGHPFGVASPAFRELELTNHGLEWVHPEFPMAHPLPDAPAALLRQNLNATASGLGEDKNAWTRLHRGLTEHIGDHVENLLAPTLGWPAHPLRLAGFGPLALPPATVTASMFRTPAAKALFMGSAAHAIAPLQHPFTSAFGALFGALGMTSGWPVARGGTGAVVDALVRVLETHGARLHLDTPVSDLRELPPADAVVLNLTPGQVMELGGLPDRGLSRGTRRRLSSWRYGTAAYKLDLLLNGPLPWRDERVAGAGTVHVVGSPEDLVAAEREAARGRLARRPFVMVCQQQGADPTRMPSGARAGQTVVWTYAHVPHGYREQRPGEVAELILDQLERFAPGTRDRVVAQHEVSPAQLEAWNPNLVGGDIAGGSMTGLQALLRPGFTADPHRLGEIPGGPRLYLASSSTPPGAGVHGMPGLWASRAVLADHTN